MTLLLPECHGECYRSRHAAIGCIVIIDDLFDTCFGFIWQVLRILIGFEDLEFYQQWGFVLVAFYDDVRSADAHLSFGYCDISVYGKELTEPLFVSLLFLTI